MGIAGSKLQTPTAAAATNVPRRVGADSVLNIDRSPDMVGAIPAPCNCGEIAS